MARRFNIWDVDGWMRQLTWKQLLMWLEFERLEPEGEDKEVRSDLRAGVVAAQVANTALNFGWAKGERYRPDHFFPGLARLRQEQETAQPVTKQGRVISAEEFQAWKDHWKARGQKKKPRISRPTT